MNKLTTLAAASTLALASQTATAESNNTSSESINANASAQIEVVKDSVCNQTKLALEMEKCSLEMPQLDENNSLESEKEIRDYFLANGLPEDIVSSMVFLEEDSPELANSYRVVRINTQPGQFEEAVLKQELFGSEAFYQENQEPNAVAQRIEQLAAKMGDAPYHLQYVEDKWIQNMAEVAPNDDEAQMIDRYISRLPDSVKAKVAWSGMTAILGLDRKQEDSEFMTLYRMSSVYSVLAATAPEKVEGAYKLLLPEDKFGKGVGYPFVEPTLENISTVNVLLNTKIPDSEVQDYEEMYARGEQEYKQSLTADIAKKFEKPGYLERVLKRYGSKIGILESDSPEIVQQKAIDFIVADRMDSYESIMNKLYAYTNGDNIRGINKLKDYTHSSILDWEGLDGAYKIIYDNVISEIKLQESEETLELTRNLLSMNK